LDLFGLFDKVIAYVKDKGSNLSTMTSTLTNVVTYSSFQLISLFMGLCFGHAKSKACEYAYDDSNVHVNMLVMIPGYVLDFQKSI
jgi:hypothetical protein